MNLTERTGDEAIISRRNLLDNIVTVEIFLNETRGHRFTAYTDGDELRRAFVGGVDRKQHDDESLLHWLFREFNIHHPTGYDDRSLSAGDVVTLNGVASYAVEAVGFRLLDRAITGATDGGNLDLDFAGRA